MLVKADEHLAC